jgi:hypothetical protein
MSKTAIDPCTNDDLGLAIEASRQEPARANKKVPEASLASAPEISSSAETARNMEGNKQTTKRTRPSRQAAPAAVSNQATGAVGHERSATDQGGPRKPDARKTKSPSATMAETVLGLLRRKKGASIDEMKLATGWQAHSLRGLLSGTIGKRMGLALESAPDKSGVRRYRIVDQPAEQEG